MNNGWNDVKNNPKCTGQYLVVKDVFGGIYYDVLTFSKNPHKEVDGDDFDKNEHNVWCEYDSEYGWDASYDVVAWQPIPQYK